MNEDPQEKLFTEVLAEKVMSRGLRSKFLHKPTVSPAVTLISYTLKISKDRFSIFF